MITKTKLGLTEIVLSKRQFDALGESNVLSALFFLPMTYKIKVTGVSLTQQKAYEVLKASFGLHDRIAFVASSSEGTIGLGNNPFGPEGIASWILRTQRKGL